jgi:hypothetical protein
MNSAQAEKWVTPARVEFLGGRLVSGGSKLFKQGGLREVVSFLASEYGFVAGSGGAAGQGGDPCALEAFRRWLALR